MNRLRVTACAFLPATLGLGACVAEPPPIKTTRLVSFNDGDFAKARDIAHLKRRVELAANAVCLDPRVPEIDLDCKSQALRDAREQMERVIADRKQDQQLAAGGELHSKGDEQ
jgi:UrcA family protein